MQKQNKTKRAAPSCHVLIAGFACVSALSACRNSEQSSAPAPSADTDPQPTAAAPAEPAALQPPAGTTAPPAQLQAQRAEQAARSKIVNGRNADPLRWPWIAAIGMGDGQGGVSSYCAGTLIARGWLLTGAHCEVLAGDFAVMGRPDLSKHTGKVVEIVEVIPHPRFDPATLDFDVALARLSDEQAIDPVAMTDDAESAVTNAGEVWIAGWGQLGEFRYDRPNALQEVNVTMTSQASCVQNYLAIDRVVTDNMFCARGDANGGDACKGDSGGPIVAFDPIDAQGRPATLLGVISKGAGCARPGYPGIYARLSRLLTWVNTCMDQPSDASCR
jgi:secreted trypsin-like serine protease